VQQLKDFVLSWTLMCEKVFSYAVTPSQIQLFMYCNRGSLRLGPYERNASVVTHFVTSVVEIERNQ
jgi:hypothetical protein